MDRFITVATVSEVERGRGKGVRWEEVPLAIFNSWGAFYVVEDRCTVCGGSLADADMKGSIVLCARDRAAFYLPQGVYMGPGDAQPLNTLRVRIEADEIRVDGGELGAAGFPSPWAEDARVLERAVKG